MKKENKTVLKYLLLIVAFVTATTLLLCYWEWNFLAIIFSVPTITFIVLPFFTDTPTSPQPPQKKNPLRKAAEDWVSIS